jgi:crotonobetainyl-CoA:carnitine CoA-transferase CaiB-like acyl-CoA transferase
MPGPLADVTVLDLTEWIAGPLATKFFADYGADVIKVERPGGDGSRRVGPFKDDDPHPEKSGTFFYYNLNKRSLGLNLKQPPDQQAPNDQQADALELFGRLVDRADIVVQSYRPGVLDRLGVGWDFIHARKPEIALVSITPFGNDSPYRDYKVTDGVLYGLAGEMYSMGIQEREPTKMFGTAALAECGAAASTAIMAALTVTELQGIGQHVDFALADAQFNGVDRRHAAAIGNRFSGRKTLRSPGPASGILSGVYPCADGYVEFTSAANNMPRVINMLGSPDWLQDPKWLQPGLRVAVDLVEEFNLHFLVWCLERTKREIWEEARGAKVLCGPLFTVDELFEDRHFRDRNFWLEVEHEAMGTFEIPGRPMLLSQSPWEYRRPAPLYGEHTHEILTECGYSEPEVRALAEAGVVEVRS